MASEPTLKEINKKNQLPAKRRWQPGKSGNPNGTQLQHEYRVSTHVRSLLKQSPEWEDLVQMSDLDKALKKAIGGKVLYCRLIAKSIIFNSLKGNPNALRELLERTEGKVAEKVELNDNKLSVTFNLSPPGASESPSPAIELSAPPVIDIKAEPVEANLADVVAKVYDEERTIEVGPKEYIKDSYKAPPPLNPVSSPSVILMNKNRLLMKERIDSWPQDVGVDIIID